MLRGFRQRVSVRLTGLRAAQSVSTVDRHLLTQQVYCYFLFSADKKTRK